ncbi:MAG: hypothetical protein IANPNBLG_04784 [Bryobacteraceae bacterium]|nr:hypothetical protein [Bryobacteraceae bacterium]
MSRAQVKWALNAASFAREALGFPADEAQERLLEGSPRRVVLNCTRQWGKSTVTAAKAVHHAYFHEGSLTLVMSPSLRQSGEFVRKAGDFLGKLGIRRRGDGDNGTSLLLPNGSRIVGLPGNETTVRGFSKVGLLILDEAARVGDALYHSLRPAQAVADGALWLMSTPNGKRGFFHGVWERGGEEWERVAIPATQCPRISRRFLEEQRATMGERWFRQEYLCEFTDAEDQVFSGEAIEGAMTDEVEPLRVW